MSGSVVPAIFVTFPKSISHHNKSGQCHIKSSIKAKVICRFVTFERDSSVEQVFQTGSMHELSGKRVEVKSATPRGSGPIAGRGGLVDQRMWGPRPMGGRGMGVFPGQLNPQGYGMGGYGGVG